MIPELAQSAIDSGFGFWAVMTAVLVGFGITIARRGNGTRPSSKIEHRRG